MRKFEKISYEQWQKDIGSDKDVYDNHVLPKRATKYSAGYDLYSPIDFVLHPGEIKKVPTGIKIDMNGDEMFLILVRSSMGIKYNVRLTNQVGFFEKDYCNNPSNEGHAWLCFQNHGEEDFVVHIGDRIAQGVFTKFLTVDDEEDIDTLRTGGIGSTGRE